MIRLSAKFIFFLSIWTFVNCWTSTKITNYPYHVTITRNNKFLCNGAIIDRYFVITSAVCAQKLNRFKECSKRECRPDDIISSGSSSYQSGGTTHYIKSVWIAPGFNRTTLENDLGLITVNEPFELGNVLRLPEKFDKLYDNRLAVITAWTESLPTKQPILQRFHVHLWSDDKCQNAVKGELPDTMFCTQFTAKKCIDELGSPITVDGNVLIGVMSNSDRDCKPSQPRFYTKTAPFAQGIRTTISDYLSKLDETSEEHLY